MKKKHPIKKIIASISISLLVFLSGLITLILNPQVMYAEELEHEKFKVYSNSPLPEAEIIQILNETHELIKGSELYDPDYKMNIVCAYQSFYNRLDNFFLNPDVAAHPTANNIIIKLKVDFHSRKIFTDRSEIDLVYLLAHEIVHAQQQHKYGMKTFNPFSPPAMWKLEGYPEYVSRKPFLESPDYDLKEQLRRYKKLKAESKDGWLKIDEKHFMPDYYYKGRLITEYLIDQKNYTYDQILKEPLDEGLIYQEMLDWTGIGSGE